MIDPQVQVINWMKQKDSRNIDVVQLTQKNWLKVNSHFLPQAVYLSEKFKIIFLVMGVTLRPLLLLHFSN